MVAYRCFYITASSLMFITKHPPSYTVLFPSILNTTTCILLCTQRNTYVTQHSYTYTFNSFSIH